MVTPVKIKALPAATMKFKAVTSLPAQIIGGTGITATFANGAWTVSVDIAGGVVQPFDADLTAIAALSSTGFPARTATNTWSQRTITGTAAEIDVANGAGIAGNPTLSLPAALTLTGKVVTGGEYASPTISGTATISATATVSGAWNFTVTPTSSSATAGAAAGPFINTYRNNTAAADNLVGGFSYFGNNSASAFKEYARSQARIKDHTAASEDGEWSAWTMVAGTLAERVTIGQGAQIGAPTGGDPGAGGLNVAGSLLVNNVAVPTISSASTLTNKTLTSPTINAAALSGTLSGTPTFSGANFITLGNLATQAAWSFLANNTSGAAAPTAITINGLTNKASPAAADEVIIWDVAGAALKKTTANALSTVGSVSSLNGQTGALVVWSPPQGRLTLNTATRVMGASYAAQGTVYYTPAVGNLVPIYDGTNIIPTVFTERSQATTDATKSPAAVTTNSNYDIFVWNDAGTIRATRGPPWSSSTSRGTGAGTTELVAVSGLFLNAVNITNGPAAQRGTYVGTIRSNASSLIDFILGGSASGGTAGVLGVWNMYNRALTNGQTVDTGVAYGYQNATIRQARGASGTGNQVSFITGFADDAIMATYFARLDVPATTGTFANTGIGLDSLTTFLAQGFVYTGSASAVIDIRTTAVIINPQIGWHTVSANENSQATTSVNFDGSNNNTLSVGVWN
jgi:hypothetical protein